MKKLLRYWWPAYVFVFPLLFFPTAQRDLRWDFAVHLWVSLGFVVIGIFGELVAHPDTRISHITGLFAWLRRRPVLLVAWLYALWAVSTSYFAVSPVFALTGSPEGLGDGALWIVLMVTIATLVSLRVEEDPLVTPTLLKAFLGTGLILAIFATIEVLGKRAWIGNFAPDVLPQVTFPSKGHLGGFLGFALGAALYLLNPYLVLVLSLGLGLTYNRAALLGALFALLLVLRRFGFRSFFQIGLIMLFGILLGFTIVRFSGSGGGKPLENPSSLEQRWYGWKAALAGIKDRPLTGYGAGGFHFLWPRYFSQEDLAYFLRIMWGARAVLSKGVNGEGIPAFGIIDREGTLRVLVVDSFKAHNEFLDQALLYGLPGAFLWLFIVILAVRRAWATPVAAALVSYLGFLGFWYSIFYIQGVFWALIGVAGGRIATSRSVPGSTGGE